MKLSSAVIRVALSAAAALPVLLAVGADPARGQDAIHMPAWVRESDSPGDWFDAANWDAGVPGPASYATIDNGGTAVIAGGAARGNTLWLGVSTESSLEITGGSTEFSYALDLGTNANGRGRLAMTAGELKTSLLHLGNNAGEGIVQQSGGAVEAGSLTLGGWQYGYIAPSSGWEPEDYGRGRYRLAGGTLAVTGDATIGSSGVGEFRQDSGRVEMDGDIHIGGVLDSLGPLTVEPTQLPMLPALDTQRALATDSLRLDVWFPPIVPSRGRYDLHGGEFAGGDLLINRTGVFRQTAGEADVEFVAVRSGGRLNLRGGSLHAEAGLHGDAELDFDGREFDLSVGAGILDFSAGVRGVRNAHIAAGVDSLVILPAGFDANTQFGSFNRQGLVHVAGGDLNVPADKRIAGAGVIDDFVIARGTIAAAADHGINLSGGLRLHAGAQVDLGSGGVATAGRTSTIQGGSLAAARVVVGGTLAAPWEYQFNERSFYSPFNDPAIAQTPGLIRQEAGNVQVDARVSVLSGTYRMAGGELEANSIDVGVNQLILPGAGPIRARFVQTGGTVRTPALGLSQTYLYAYLLTDYGATAGDGPIENVVLPDVIELPPFSPGVATIDSRYRIDGGLLEAEEMSLGASWYGTDGTTRFEQTGGRVVASRWISMHGANSSFVMSGGSLTARRVVLGADYAYPATVTPADSASLVVRDAASRIEIPGELVFGGGSHFRAVSGTTIRMTNPDPATDDWRVLASSQFRNVSLNADDLAGLGNLALVFDGMTATASTLEVAGEDRGPGPAGYRRNFALGSLHVGGASPSWLRLVDIVDNQRDRSANEALYVDTLIVSAGSMLDLGGLNLYYRHAELAGDVDLAGGSMFAAVPEPSSLGLCGIGLGAVLAMRGRGRRAAHGPAMPSPAF